MPRPTTSPRRPLAVERLDDRLTPVAALYAGVPLTAAIPAHTPEPLPASFVYYVSPTGAGTGTNGTRANPFTLNEAVGYVNNTANVPAGQVPTLVFRGGTYSGVSQGLDRPMVLQAFAGEQPWLDGAAPVSNWAADASTVPGRTVWRMGTSSFDPDGAGPAGPRNFEFPQSHDFHYVDVTKNPFCDNGEMVFVGDGAAAPAPVKQVGLYRKTAPEPYTVNVGGTAAGVQYVYRRSSDNKLLAPGGVPAATFAGAAIDGGGTTDADYQAAVSVANNLTAAASANAALDTLVDNAQGLAGDKFFVDYVGHQLYVAADPTLAGRTLLVTATSVGLYANTAADGTVVRGLGFTRYARTGLQAYSCERLRLDSDAAAWNGYAGLSVNGADTVARGNVAVANGQSGLDGSGDRLLAENNAVSYSNVERYATNWSAAGWKVTGRQDMVFRGNTFLNNFCTALWLDINTRGVMVVNNFANNAAIGGGFTGYFSEISDNNTIAFNVAYQVGTGLLVSGTSRNRIYNNTFVLCGTAVAVKDYDRTNDTNEDGGAVGGGGAFDGDPNEGGEDDKQAALGSTWDAYDNELFNNIFADTRGTYLVDAASTQDPYNGGDPLLNSRVIGRPYDSRTMLLAMDFNGYHTLAAADRFVNWDPGLAADVAYDTPAQFEAFKALYGLEQHTSTSGTGQLVFEGVADPFLADVANGDYRPRAGGPAVGRGVAAGTLRAVPADILAAAGRPQPTFLGALPPATSDAVAPTASAVAAQTIPENTGTAALSFNVGDDVTPAAALSVVATSSNPDLLPLAGIVLGGGGAARTVTLSPAANQAGTVVVTLTVSDAAGNRTATTFRLTVSVVSARAGFTSGGSTSRTAPTLGVKDTPLQIPFVLSNAAGVTAVSWGEEFVPQASLSWAGTGPNRTLTLTPVPGGTGILSLDIVASNAAGATTTRRIFVDFRAADGNRAPRIHTVLNRGLPVGVSTGKVEYTVNDLEQPTGAGLVVTASSSDPLLVPAGNLLLGGEADSNPDSRWVQVTPAAGRSGVAVITLSVRDNGADGVAGTADDAVNTRRFSVFVNSAPTGVLLSPNSVAENLPAGTAVGTLTAQDPGALGDRFTFELVAGAGGTDNARFAVAGNQLRLAGPLDYEAQASYAVRVRVTDFLGATFDQLLTVVCQDVNEPPVVTSDGGGATAAVSVAEGGLTATTVTARDPESGTTGLTFSLAGGADQARFSIGGTSGVLRFVSPPDFLLPADADGDNVYVVVVKVADAGGLFATQTIRVRVTQVVTGAVGVNGGAAQRSRVTTLAVTFNAAVSLQPGAFALTRPADGQALADGGATPGVAVSLDATGRVATLTFLPAGGPLVEYGSLADGAWVLRVDRTRVTAATGAMATDLVTPTAGAGRLFRLFGDADGSGSTSALEVAQARAALNTQVGAGGGYDPLFDFDGNGSVSALDLARVRSRLNVQV